MKRFLILTITILSLLLVSCTNTPRDWHFAKDLSEIAEIKIVNVDAEHYKELETYEVIKEIDLSLAEELCSEIDNIDAKRYNFMREDTCGTCFLIVYAGGEYELISVSEPLHFIYSSDGKMLGPKSATWLKFDKEQFNALIDKYLNMEESTEN
ncbi:MAG: hypothetical protein E7642_02440 [Ruminococcaceae bacterium]|nr:hypothetical protein [Oscillospiraceae bacterium]